MMLKACNPDWDKKQTVDGCVDLPFDINQPSAVMALNQTSPNDLQCNGFIYNKTVIPALYFIMFPISLLLNGVAAWVSLHLKSTSTFVVYLKNLVAADIVMTLTIPIKAASDLSHESHVFILSCYISPIFYSAQYICIALLGVISLDRFFKIIFPRCKFSQNVTISKVISGSVWVILFGSSALPNIILTNKPVTNITKITTCMHLKGQAGLELHESIIIYLNVFFWLISLLIAVCYICITNKVIQSFRNSGSNNSQGNQKVKLRVFMIVIVFFVSFGPYHIIRVPYTFQQIKQSSSANCYYLKGKFGKELSLWFASTNICMNPLLYIFLCREFKEQLMSMMKNVPILFNVSSAGKAQGASPKTRF
ncbi:P2Y purinoceptor 13-like [Symphorus nematophorus]